LDTKTKILSVEGAIGLLVAIFAAAGDMNWIERGILVLFGLGLIVDLARRIPMQGRFGVLTKAVFALALASSLLYATCGPIWEDFHKKNPNVVFHWPITFGISERANSLRGNPPDMPPLDLPGPPLSHFGKVLYICPAPPKVDSVDRDAAVAVIRRNADIYGNALGLSLVLNDIPYGVRFDLTPKNTEGESRMVGVQRVTIQLEAASQGIFVTVLMHLTGAMAMLESMGVDRDSDMEKLWTKQVEQMVSAPEGKCRLL
jgi:hypothetical protein